VNALGIAITPDGSRAYVANNVSDSVSVIALATDTVIATVAMFQPVGVALTPDSTRAYVTNSSEVFGSVSVIDTATNALTATIDIGPNAQTVAITPDGSRAYAASFGSDSLWVIDTATNAVIATVAVGSGPVGVAVTAGIGPPTAKNQCKHLGWQTFTVPRTFKNQGDCISHVATNSANEPG